MKRTSPAVFGTRRSHGSRGSRAGWVKVAVLVAAVGGVGAAVAAGAKYASSNGVNPAANEPTKKVARGELLITVIEDGNLESASNVDVKCQVAGGSSILWIVPDGEYVNEGDKIVELDSASLEDQINTQRNAFEKARAAKIQAEQDVEVAKISVDEYLEGTYLKEVQDADKEITIARENLRSAESALEHAKTMFRKGYVSSNELDAQKFAVERANLELASAQTAKDVLEKFSKAKKLEELESTREIAQARMDSELAAYELEEKKLKRLEDQLANCMINAPQSGMIVYANQGGGRFGGGQGVIIEEGATVRERQDLVKIPDLTKMQVKVNVHESKVEELRTGMLASIVVQGEKFKGTVESVANQPEPTSWFQGNVKEYATIVKISGDADNLKPGMTSEVTILVAHLKDVLYLPLACVAENKGRYFVWASKNGRPERMEIQVGLSNESFVEIKGGIDEGVEVFENPTKFEKSYIDESGDSTEDDATSDFGDTSNAVQNTDAGKKGGSSERGGEAASAGRGGAPAAAGSESSGRGGPPSSGRGGPGGGSSFDPAKIFDGMDADGDGVIKGDEIPDRMKDRVDSFDTDGDGGISKEEWTETMKKYSSGRGQ